MNILYLFGNGFDINLGLKTRYTDFYAYFNGRNSTSNLIEDLKRSISKDIENWADLELEFGKYTSNFNNIDEFDMVYEDLLNSLCDYLDEEFKKYDFGKLNIDQFLTDICISQNYLATQDTLEINDYKKKWGQNDRTINIITYNYTTSVEKILESVNRNNIIGTYRRSNYYLKDIIHIHGFTDNRTILGVNDLTQVSNLEFHNNNDFIEALVKVESNARQRHNIDQKCESLINSADLIYIFGCSLGATDKFWWNLISYNLKRGIKVIIYFKFADQNQRLAHRPLRLKRKVRDLFWNNSDLSDDEKENLDKNIYIQINADIFNLQNVEHFYAS